MRLTLELYRLPVAEHQRSGLVARLCRVQSIMICRRSCVSAFYGGHAQGAFGRAGFLTPRSTNLRMAATFRLVAKVMAPYLQENHQC